MSIELNSTIPCPVCNRVFTKRHYNQRYCCGECTAEMVRRNSKKRGQERTEKERETRRKRKKGKSELARINQLARAAGMSYGRYVELETRAKVKVERRTV